MERSDSNEIAGFQSYENEDRVFENRHYTTPVSPNFAKVEDVIALARRIIPDFESMGQDGVEETGRMDEMIL